MYHFCINISSLSLIHADGAEFPNSLSFSLSVPIFASRRSSKLHWVSAQSIIQLRSLSLNIIYFQNLLVFVAHPTKRASLAQDIFKVGQIGWLVVWVLWRINLCRLFNPKFCLYIYIPFTNEYLVGKIFYKQDFTCLHMINRF